MANRSSIAYMAGLLLLATLPGFAKDTTYKDPRNPSFSILVPDGWAAKRTDSGVSLSHVNSSVILNITAGSRPADDMLADVVSQFQKQARSFRDIDKGQCRFGGEKGVYAVFSGIGPNGTSQITKVVTMTNGQLVYLLIEEARPDEYEDEKGDLQRIQDSFAPEAIATTVDDREKLDALYAAGVISQQEYEARVKNLGGSAAARQASKAVSPVNPPDASGTNSQKPATPVQTDAGTQRDVARVPSTKIQNYLVVHFALGATMNWAADNCVGWMTIDNGAIAYRAIRGTHGLHQFDIPISNIKEAKKNAFIGSGLQAFHIRLKHNENYDFALLDNTGQYLQNPSTLLDAIHTAMK